MSADYPSDDSVSLSGRSVDSDVLSLTSSSHDDRGRRRGSSVHTAAALSVVGPARRRSARSVHYADAARVRPRPRPLSARSSALADVLPSGGDRLKHLHVHMEQLQQLYALEVHKEELAAREAFVQSVCTASITLWRHACSRPRFFTAVKALATQYLPAADARLFEVEGQRLVRPDGRSADEGSGVAGHALLAVARPPADDDERSSEDDAPPRSWLDRHADCFVPSSNDHVVVVIPLERVYRDSGFDPEIDLAIRRKDLLGSTHLQLLVLVMRDSQQRAVGVLEALVSTKNAVKLDFLDVFASLLAAALEARKSICRPTTGGAIRVHIVRDEDVEDTAEGEKPMASVMEIAPGVKMVVEGGGGAQSQENDLPLVKAFQQPMAELYAQATAWQQCAEVIERICRSERQFWSDVVALATESVASANSSVKTLRSGFRAALARLIELRGDSVDARVLFQGESLEDYTIENATVADEIGLSIEGQFGAMEHAILTGEVFESTQFVRAIPVRVGHISAAVLAVSHDVGDEHEGARNQILLIARKGLETLLSAESLLNDRCERDRDLSELREVMDQTEYQKREAEFVLSLTDEMMELQSFEELAVFVNSLVLEPKSSRSPRIRLFVAEYGGESSEGSTTVSSIWTTNSDNLRVQVYDPARLSSPRTGSPQRFRGGMAAFILDSGEPLCYTQHHQAYDLQLRQIFASPNHKRGYYYAAPLRCGDLVRAIVEYSFASENEQQQFAKSTFAATLTSTLGGSIRVLDALSSKDNSHVQVLADREESYSQSWLRWSKFMHASHAPCDTSGRSDVSEWKTKMTSAILDLVPAATHANLLLDLIEDDRSLLARVKEELRVSSTSHALNIHNQVLLRAVRIVPLRKMGHLVLARSSACDEEGDKIFNLDVDKYGGLVCEALAVNLLLSRAQQSIQDLSETISILKEDLSGEQHNRKLTARQIRQDAVLFRVSNILDDHSSFQLPMEVAKKVVLEICREEGIRVCLLIFDEEAGDWSSIRQDEYAPSNNFDAKSVEGALNDLNTPMTYKAPFTGAVPDIVKRLWPGVLDQSTSELWIAPILLSPQGSQTSFLVMSMAEENSMECFSGHQDFVMELTKCIGRVFAMNRLHQTSQELQGRLEEVAGEVDTGRKDLLRVITSRSHVAAMRRAIFSRLWTLERPQQIDEAHLSEVHSQLISDLEHHTVQQVSAALKNYDYHYDVDVCMMCHEQDDRGTDAYKVSSVLSRWMTPTDISRVVRNGRRQGSKSGNDTMIENLGGPGDGVFVALWHIGNHVACAFVHLQHPIESAQSHEIESDIEEVLEQVLEVWLQVQNVISLNRRLLDMNNTSKELALLIESKSAELTRVSTAVGKSAEINQVLSSLSQQAEWNDTSAFNSSLLAAMEKINGYRLWVRKTEDVVTWVTSCDGKAEIQPRGWSPNDDHVKIDVDSECVAIVEVRDGAEGRLDELEIIASVCRNAFTTYRVSEKLREAQAATIANAAKEEAREETEVRQRAEVMDHWRSMDHLLRSKPCHEEELSHLQAEVEAMIVQTISDVLAVRVVKLDIDLEQHRIVRVKESSTKKEEHGSETYHRLATLLKLWSPSGAAHAAILSIEEDESHIVRRLFPSSHDLNATIVMVAVRVDSTSFDSSLHEAISFVLIVGLVEVCNIVTQAFEMDARLIATAIERAKEFDLSHRRAREAEMSLIAAQEDCALAQQWIEFAQSCDDHAKRLVASAFQAISKQTIANPWDVVATEAESFTNTACGCEYIELYSFVVDPIGDGRQLIPLATHGASLSPTARSRAFTTELLALVNESTSAEDVLEIESTSTGNRIVRLIRDVGDAHTVGVLVVYWSGDCDVSDATLEAVNAVVCPWLGVVFSILRLNDTNRISLDASNSQIEELMHAKSAIELECLDIKKSLSQAESRNASLQGTIQFAIELLTLFTKQSETVRNIGNRGSAWTSLGADLTSLDDIRGVLICDAPAGQDILLRSSTLSNMEDDIICQAIRARKATDVGVSHRCITTRSAQELRVSFHSEFRRVRVVCLDWESCQFLLVVFQSDTRTSHQHIAFLDWFVDMSVALTRHRLAELEKMEMHTELTSALEASLEDLRGRLQHETGIAEASNQRIEQLEALRLQLGRDLVGHEIWNGLDKITLASVSTVPTKKLVGMWRFLEDLAETRLRRALFREAVTVQLYGVVQHSSTKNSFVFSLPSQGKSEPQRSATKGFFCVAFSSLEQRREWRKMTECIVSRRPVPLVARVESGTCVFPILAYKSRIIANYSDERHDEEGYEDFKKLTGVVVGVLVLKIKAGRTQGSETCGLLSTPLIQSFVDDLAPRVEWIGRAVDKKQQSGNMTHNLRREVSGDGKSFQALISNANVQPGRSKSFDSMDGTHANAKSLLHTVTTRHSNPHGEEASLNYHSSSENPSNQDQDDECDNEVDSEDERAAEQAHDRMRAAISAGVMEFSLRVQSLHNTSEDYKATSDSLRHLVARDLKSVWTMRGDSRKKGLDACELFFLVNGSVRDQLHADLTPASAPHWLLDVVQGFSRNQQVTVGLCTWKQDASHWVVTEPVLQPNQNPVIMMLALTGSSSLSTVFDSTDERLYFPWLLQTISIEVGGILEAHYRARAQVEQASQNEKIATQHFAEARARYEELANRSKREQELNAVTLQLLHSPDERKLIQSALEIMRQWLGCTQVAFHVAPQTSSHHEAIGSQPAEPEGGDRNRRQSGADMETVVRVRVSCQKGEDDRKMIGTLVARLTDEERNKLNQSSVCDDGSEWMMRQLDRLGDAVGTTWLVLRQRQSLQQATAALKASSEGIESQQEDMNTLRMENSRLQSTIDELREVVDHNQDVERHNDDLRVQLEQSTEQLEDLKQERSAMATQLKRYESQLIEVNSQLEHSIRAETQLMRLEEAHAVVQTREARLEKKLLKYKLQHKQLVSELTMRRDKDERDQAELMELRREVAVLKEKQQHATSTDASSVVTAVMQAQAHAQAQAQAQVQSQAMQLQHTQTESKQQQQRAQAAIQRRFFRQLQLQQQMQKRKQLDLAQELRQLAALEVQEMTRHNTKTSSRDYHAVSAKKKLADATSEIRDAAEAAEVHNLRQNPTWSRSSALDNVKQVPVSAAGSSKLRPPSITVGVRRSSAAGKECS